MSRLSKQSIRRLCEGPAPMIHPFEPEKVRVHGVSKGLSHASYDASIAHDLVLGRHPGYVIKQWVIDNFFGNPYEEPSDKRRPWYYWPGTVIRSVLAINKLLGALANLAWLLYREPPAYALANTVEDFNMPPNVGGDVADKSTFARVFVSAYNTFFDPGFRGNATLELVNDSDKRVEYKAGQGVCQFIFTWLDEETEEPYSGKYQGQTKQPHGARFEPDTRLSPRLDKDRVEDRPYLQAVGQPPQGMIHTDGAGVQWQGGIKDASARKETPLEAAKRRLAQAENDYAPGWMPDRLRGLLLADVNRAKQKEAADRQVELDKLRFGRETPWDAHQRELEARRDAAGLGQG